MVQFDVKCRLRSLFVSYESLSVAWRTSLKSDVLNVCDRNLPCCQKGCVSLMFSLIEVGTAFELLRVITISG